MRVRHIKKLTDEELTGRLASSTEFMINMLSQPRVKPNSSVNEEKLQQENRDLRQRLSNRNLRVDELEKSNTRLLAKFREIQKNLLPNGSNATQSDNRRLQERINALVRSNTDQNNELKKLRTQIFDLTQQLTLLQKELSEARKEASDERNEANRLRSEAYAQQRNHSYKPLNNHHLQSQQRAPYYPAYNPRYPGYFQQPQQTAPQYNHQNRPAGDNTSRDYNPK